MKRRSPKVGVKETFYPFERLPTELRHKIWQFTLEPRVVEVLSSEDKKHPSRIAKALKSEEDDDDEEEDEEDEDGVTFFARAALPTALQVCRDSRDAVLSMYPLCFQSDVRLPRVRFSLSLDTLYIDVGIGAYFPELMRNLRDIERSKLASLALSSGLGYHADEEIWENFWEELESQVDRFTGLEEILIVADIMLAVPRRLVSIGLDPRCTEEAQQLKDKFGLDYARRGVEILDEYPAEVFRRLKRLNMDMIYEVEGGFGIDWIRERAKLVWGWRRLKYDKT